MSYSVVRMCSPLPESDFKNSLPLLGLSTTVFVLTQTMLWGFLLLIVSLVVIYGNLYCGSALALSQVFNMPWNTIQF